MFLQPMEKCVPCGITEQRAAVFFFRFTVKRCIRRRGRQLLIRSYKHPSQQLNEQRFGVGHLDEFLCDRPGRQGATGRVGREKVPHLWKGRCVQQDMFEFFKLNLAGVRVFRFEGEKTLVQDMIVTDEHELGPCKLVVVVREHKSVPGRLFRFNFSFRNSIV